MDEKIAAAIIVSVFCEEEPREKKKRSVWVKPMFQKRNEQGDSENLLRELRFEDPANYRNYLRVDDAIFDFLLEGIRPLIEKQDTKFREAIPAETRLALTLRYLATGDSYQSLKFAFRVSAPAISAIIPEVCNAICTTFQKEFVHTPPTEDEWLKIAKDFNDQWNFPNCIGALDGKHVTIEAPPNSGSHYHNYKGSFSFVLMALVDANLKFIFVDVGTNGRASDGGVWAKCELGKRLESKQMQLPKPTLVGERHLPYVIVADEAFPLKEYLMRPFSRRDLNASFQVQKVFNYRLSRARRIVENAFGVMAAVFRVFRKPMAISLQNAKTVVMTCCVLHNILRANSASSKVLAEKGVLDVEDTATAEIIHGQWRQETNAFGSVIRLSANSYSDNAKEVREAIANYFVNEGAVFWQDKYM